MASMLLPAVGIEILALYSHVNLPFQYQNQAPKNRYYKDFGLQQHNQIAFLVLAQIFILPC